MLEDELFVKAKMLVKNSKKIMRLLYQLCFIETSMSPKSHEAHKLIEEMIEKGLITKAQYQKALEDVERWREKILDKVWRRI